MKSISESACIAPKHSCKVCLIYVYKHIFLLMTIAIVIMLWSKYRLASVNLLMRKDALLFATCVVMHYRITGRESYYDDTEDSSR